MKPTLYAYTGQIGVGKTFCSIKKMQELKSDGITCMSMAWADSLKQVIENVFYLRKSGPIEDGDHGRAPYDFYLNLKMEILAHVSALAPLSGPEDLIIYEDCYDAAWAKHGSEITQIYHELCLNDYNSSYRRLIQLIGTEIGRGTWEDLWIELGISRIKQAFDTGIIRAAIIDDTRFLNEFQAIKDFQNTYQDRYAVEFFGVEAPIEIRAKRLGMTAEQIEEFALHDSERFVPEILSQIPPGNLIWNP